MFTFYVCYLVKVRDPWWSRGNEWHEHFQCLFNRPQRHYRDCSDFILPGVTFCIRGFVAESVLTVSLITYFLKTTKQVALEYFLLIW